MKNNKMSVILASTLLFSTVSPLTTAVYAQDVENSIVQNYEEDEVLKNLEEKEAQLEELKVQNLSDENQANVDKLIDLVEKLKQEQSNNFTTYSARSIVLPEFQSIPKRLEVITEIIETIQKTTTELDNKVQKAHVEIGFEITRAVLKVLNPNSSEENLDQAIISLRNVYEKVSQYKDISEDDVATLYVRNKLDDAIWQTRFTRDKKILGKVDFEIYNNLNKKITQSVGVQLNPKSTVAEINQAIEDLNLALEEALAYL